MIQYYIQTSIGQEGPYTLLELRNKHLDPQTPVWYEGISDWTAAGEIDALEPLFRGSSIPPPFVSPLPFNAARENSYTPARKKTDYSMFFWLALGILMIAGMFYFLKQQDINPPSAAKQALSDSTDSVAPAESAEEIRRRRMAEKLAAKNKNYRNNWNSYIKAKPGRYEKSMFGGIYNLEAVVSNKTDYPLDVMIISIDYIKESGERYKTEILTIYDIPANGEASVRAPDSDRGTSVKLEIIQISSKRMNFLYSNDIDPEGKPDPYYLNR